MKKRNSATDQKKKRTGTPNVQNGKEMIKQYNAKKTTYSNIVFKSKSEAIIARCFDLAEEDFVNTTIFWEYEPERFKIDDYAPDFIVKVGLKYKLNRKGRGVKDYILSFIHVIEYKPKMPTDSYLQYWAENCAKINAKDVFGLIDVFMLVIGSPYDDKGIQSFNLEYKDKQVNLLQGCNWIESIFSKTRIETAKRYRFDLK